MHVVIGGCGRVGAQLADLLSSDGHDVVVIDVDEAAFKRIGSTFNGEVLVGDITDSDLLVRAGIERAQAMTAVTPSDNANLMAVQIAQVVFSVPHAVARLFNPAREASYRKMGVRYVSETSMVVAALRSDLRPDSLPAHMAAGGADVEVVEVAVGPAGEGVAVDQLEHDSQVRVAKVGRGRTWWIPRPEDRLSSGDVVVAGVRRGAEGRLRALLLGSESARAEPGPAHRSA